MEPENKTRMIENEIQSREINADQSYPQFVSRDYEWSNSGGSFHLKELGDASWFFDLILSYQNSLSLEGVRLQHWNVHKLGGGKLQIICRDHNGDVLIAKLVRKKFPLSDLTVMFTNNTVEHPRESLLNDHIRCYG